MKNQIEKLPEKSLRIKFRNLFKKNYKENFEIFGDGQNEFKSKPKGPSKSIQPDSNEMDAEMIPEYRDKRFEVLFNSFADELKVLVGQMRCKRDQVAPFVKKFQLMITKVDPESQISMKEAVEKVRLAENLPSETDSTDSEDSCDIDYANPFNLDLRALSEYKQKVEKSKEINRKRDYRIFKRKMETKLIKTEKPNELKQQMFAEKFKLPDFFHVEKVLGRKSSEEVKSGNVSITKPFPDNRESFMNGKGEMADGEVSGCCLKRTAEKDGNREVEEMHYRHKIEKFKKRLELEEIEAEANWRRQSSWDFNISEGNFLAIKTRNYYNFFFPRICRPTEN